MYEVIDWEIYFKTDEIIYFVL